MFVCFFFFFKQKTAYEMRISDWSSDVCSSDLPDHLGARDALLVQNVERRGKAGPVLRSARMPILGQVGEHRKQHEAAHEGKRVDQRQPVQPGVDGVRPADPPMRSEEHTSELQSLMRISYAVFCLKKKQTNYKTNL